MLHRFLQWSEEGEEPTARTARRSPPPFFRGRFGSGAGARRPGSSSAERRPHRCGTAPESTGLRWRPRAPVFRGKRNLRPGSDRPAMSRRQIPRHPHRYLTQIVAGPFGARHDPRSVCAAKPMTCSTPRPRRACGSIRRTSRCSSRCRTRRYTAFRSDAERRRQDLASWTLIGADLAGLLELECCEAYSAR